MKYFIDTEFLEGPQNKRFLGVSYGKTKPTIDLISIGIVAEDGREYYAISKDFNLEEAWNRHGLESYDGVGNLRSKPEKVYWIRENVLMPIFYELSLAKEYKSYEHWKKDVKGDNDFSSFRYLINKHGKSNDQIAEEVKRFVNEEPIKTFGTNSVHLSDDSIKNMRRGYLTPEFYAYYADYDWVAFCWLFGRMIDLPKGFPMYCRDLKQMLDEKGYQLLEKEKEYIDPLTLYSALDIMKRMPNYPKQTNEHNALADARWNRKLHDFINS